MNMKKFLATAITVCCCAGAAVVPALAADPAEAAVHEEYQGNVSDAAQPEPGEGEEQTPEEEYRIELPETMKISTLEEYQLNAKVVPEGDQMPELKYELVSESEPGVLILDQQKGSVIAQKEGTAVVRVSLVDDGSICKECEITVGNLYSGIYQDPTGQSDNWYYYEDGQVQHITDVMRIDDVWYNLVDGKLTGDTVAQNYNGW